MFEDLIFPPEARILEIGCAYGQWAAWAAKQVPGGSVLAVDIAPELVQWAAQQFPPTSYPNLRYLQGDARELDFQTEPFDYVMTRACLHYLDHPGHAFAAISRHLKPGGRLCLICLGKGNLTTLYRSLFHTMKKPRWEAYFKDFKMPGSLVDAASCDPWLKEAGLKKTRARLFNEPIYFTDRRSFQDWFNTSFGHYLNGCPEALRPNFSDAFCEEYCRRFKPEEGVRGFRVWLQLEAVKV